MNIRQLTKVTIVTFSMRSKNVMKCTKLIWSLWEKIMLPLEKREWGRGWEDVVEPRGHQNK